MAKKRLFHGYFLRKMTATICWGSETRNCEAHTSKGGRIPLENKVPGHSCPSSVPPFNFVVICFVYCGKGMLLMLSLNHTLSTSYYSVITLEKTKWHLHLSVTSKAFAQWKALAKKKKRCKECFGKGIHDDVIDGAGGCEVRSTWSSGGFLQLILERQQRYI